MLNFTVKSLKRYLACYQGLPVACWRDITLNLVNSITIGIRYFLPLYLSSDLHFSISLIGVIISSYGLGTTLGGIIAGSLCDYFSLRLITIISLCAQCLSFWLLISSSSFSALVVTMFLLGFATYSFKTTNNLSMLNHCRDSKALRQRTINLSYAASNFGLGISGLAVGVMSQYGYNKIFYAACLILFISAISLMFESESKNRMRDQHFLGQVTEISDLNKQHEPNAYVLKCVLVLVFLIGIIVAQLGSTYPLFVETAFPELGVKAVSILFILDTVIIVSFQAVLANLSKKLSSIIVMGFGAMMMGTGMLLLSFSYFFMLAVFSGCIWTLGEMLFMPAAQLLCYENTSHKNKGRGLGYFQTVFATSMVIGPFIGGYVFSVFGRNIMWYFAFFVGVVCLIASLAMQRTVGTGLLAMPSRADANTPS